MLTALATEQARAGHIVTIATTNVDFPRGTLEPAQGEYWGKSGVRARYFGVQLRAFAVSLGLARFLYREIDASDVVHVWTLYRFPTLVAARLAKRAGVPCIIRPCGALEPPLRRQSAINLPLKRLYERLFEMRNLKSATAINCVTESEARNLPAPVRKTRVFVTGNGIDMERYERLPARGTLRRKLGIGREPIVLFLGRVNFKKGLDILIPAFVRVRDEHPEALLVIAGPENDGYGAEVRKMVTKCNLENCVHFLGHLDTAGTLEAYVDADSFVLPSYTENFGMAVVEAMACGVPVIVSDRVNIHHEVVRADAGLVVACDKEEVGAAISALLRDEGARRRMGNAGRHAAREWFSWPPLVAQLDVEYQRAIDACRPRRPK